MHADERPAATRVFRRLKKRAEFQRVSRGARKSARAFALQAAERPADGGPESARVGFTVTKKVGNSVVRNRVRRRLKEALRAAPPLEARRDHDYVVVARREALSEPFVALVDQFREAFRALATVRSDRVGEARRPDGPRRGKGLRRAARDGKSEDRRQ